MSIEINTPNTENNILLRAAKKKYRFTTAKGLIPFEDLFDLKLTDLDKIAMGIDAELQKLGRTSFIKQVGVNNGSIDLTAQLDLVKLVIEIRQTENELATQRAARRGQLDRLEELLQRKRDAELENLPIADLEKQIAELKGAA